MSDLVGNPEDRFSHNEAYMNLIIRQRWPFPLQLNTRWLKSQNHWRPHMSRSVRKLAFCIVENKAADQLRGDRAADRCLRFCCIDSTISPLAKNQISSLKPCFEHIQPALCRTWSETPKRGFCRDAAHLSINQTGLYRRYRIQSWQLVVEMLLKMDQKTTFMYMY